VGQLGVAAVIVLPTSVSVPSAIPGTTSIAVATTTMLVTIVINFRLMLSGIEHQGPVVGSVGARFGRIRGQ
jgi:hypothetical protein